MKVAKGQKISIIVPSALRVPPELEVDFGAIPPVLIPISGKVAAERIIEQYAEFDATFYIAIEEGADLVQEHFDFFPDSRVKLVRVGKTISIAHTIWRVLESYPEAIANPIVLNFADTIVEDLDPELVGQDFICHAATIESQRWTLVKTDRGRIIEVSDKQFQLDASEWTMLLGVWGFSSGSSFHLKLSECRAEENRGAFYEAILGYFNGLPNAPVWTESIDYIDCGHADSYYAARRKLISARFFNSLEFNEAGGTIRKTSANREKLIDEISWLHSLPKELSSYTPTIYDYSRDPNAPFLEMEFYSYPSLDESFVNARFDFDAWEKLFDKLMRLIRRAGKYKVADGRLAEDLHEMYVAKTRSRLDTIGQSGIDNTALATSVELNGRTIGGLTSVRKQLESVLANAGALDAESFQVIHGDLCLGNILYDAKHGLIKLIDARGRFGRYDIYGDVYYDLAKLSHSILGFYDFIVSDNFKVSERSPGSFELHLRTSDYHTTVGRIFLKYLKANGFDVARVRLIESLLFLSMIPLHRDRPDRQRAMLLQGLQLFDQAANL
ncbi:MAG: aminoglycoside phosphotransferase family protein [Fimbriimonadaceae bacterium]|nr:aminoglycoside phosphotransferase family protein [Fimbriimonadaceae bacterium]